jgi:hypothetical protein
MSTTSRKYPKIRWIFEAMPVLNRACLNEIMMITMEYFTIFGSQEITEIIPIKDSNQYPISPQFLTKKKSQKSFSQHCNLKKAKIIQ